MPRWLSRLHHEADQRQAAHQQRRLVVRESDTAGRVRHDGRSLINLASNDYLGLAEHPKLKQAASQAALDQGTGATASRLVAGHHGYHAEVEQRFAELKQAEAALILATGYTANLAAVTALVRPGDLILNDKLNHASLIDAARMAEQNAATARTYPHNNLDALHRKLKRHAESAGETLGRPNTQTFIITDSVFSMDGDVADLPGLLDLAERYDACLIVDEAHGTGVLGDRGGGLAEQQGVSGRLAAQGLTITTGSKALGGLGGIITGPAIAIDAVVNRGRPFIYSTGVPPQQVAALGAALDVIRDEPERHERLNALSQHVHAELVGQGWPLEHRAIATPIIPLIAGTEEQALALAAHLESHGICAVAIRPPTVAPGSARVRLALRCDLSDDDVQQVLDAAAAWRAAMQQ